MNLPGTPDPSVHEDSQRSLRNMETSNEETVRTPASLEPVQIPTGDVEKQEKQPRKESVSIIPPSLRNISHEDPAEGIALQKSPISASLRELPADRKTYQLRALTRKTLIYQKRQVFVNVCCIALCPFLMVAIAGLLGILVSNLISNGSIAEDILYCSNMTNLNTDVLVETPPSVVPGATTTVKHLSYFMPPLVLTGGRQKVGVRLAQCAVWIEKGYTLEPPYRPDPQIAEQIRRDTTFQPDIAGGFFGPAQLLAPSTLALKQTYPWAYLVDSAGVAGKKDKMDNVLNVTSFYATGAELGREGLLGSIPTLYFANITQNSGVIPFVVSSFDPVPFYDRTYVTSNDVSDLDNVLTDRIRSIVKRLSQVTNKEYLSKTPTDAEGLAKQLTAKINVAAIANDMPWGNLIISDLKISGTERTMEFTMQYGTDGRIASAGSYPTEGTRKAVQLAWTGNAMLRQTPFGLGQNSQPTPITITHGFRLFPLLSSTALNLPIGSLIGRVLYPFGVSFLLPIFVITLVREKEDRVLVMMRMSGLKNNVYYLTHYIHFYTLHVMATFVFIISGLIFQMDLFTRTDPGVYILLFFMWGHAQIALAFLFSCIFSKSRSALVIVFLLVLCGVINNLVMESLFTDGTPAAYYIYPPFAFYRALSMISTASVGTGSKPYSMKDLHGQDEVFTSIIFLLVETFVYLALSFYLSSVLPTEFGVRKPWHFIFTDPVKYYKERKTSQTGPRNGNEGGRRDLPGDVDRPINEIEVADEDDDVRAERDRVLKNLENPECALIVKRMRKVYGTGAKLAVKDVTLAVEPNMVFGLLGPNGAGKTTLISILTGLYEPSSGTATLAGYDISKEMDKVYKSIGVCPQHDILWDDLTCEEHLMFYARLKGIPPADENAAVKQSLQYVKLGPFADRRAKGLSGGEKRRLSIAIALIANPTVVFLDEPTTGLDPEVRRIVWDVVNTAKVGRTIILTTHSMEEAEVLCSRIGIMAKGTLRCLGNQLRLKQLYGSGFRLSFTAQAEDMPRAAKFVESLLPSAPDAWKKLDAFTTTASYEFRNTENGVIPRIFESLERGKTENGVEDWSVSQTTLEEVFLRIVQEAEAEAD